MDFKNSSSWNILTHIEQSIKQKIEQHGTPLKRLGLKINRGVLTGLNEAFIISTERKDELIAEDPNSADLIRPILRGRDISRYHYTFADLWLIATFPSKNYNIDDYPSIKRHLLSFGIERLEQTGKKHIVDGVEIKSRKKTTNKWFETQDSIKYWNDFSKQKIVYREISDAMDACLVGPEYMLNNKCYLITGNHLIYILCYLNSKLFNKIILQQANVTGGKGEGFLNTVSLVYPTEDIEQQIEDLYAQLKTNPLADSKIDELFCEIYDLTDDETNFILA